MPAGVDKYNRELAKLRYDTSFGQLDVAETMISKGQAFYWGGNYYKAQCYAAENRLGVWADLRYQERPWLYHRRMGITTN